MDTASEFEGIDLTRYLRALRRQMKKIIALTVVTSIIAILVAMSLTPIYQASSTLMIESGGTKVVSIEEVYGIPQASDEYFNTQFEILKSRELAKRITEKLNLVNTPEFNPYHLANEKSFSFKSKIKMMIYGESEPPTDEEVFAATVDTFWESVNVAPIGKTQLVMITVTSKNPALAMKAANAMTNGYIESQLEAKIQVNEQASGWLQDRLGGLKEALTESEKKLQQYREENNLVDVAGVGTLVAREIDQTTSRLVEARSQRIELGNTYFQIKNMDFLTYENLSSLPIIINNPLVVTLRARETSAELKKSELSKRYGPSHPKMVAAESDLQAVRDSVGTQMRRIASSIEREYIAARNKEESLQQALNNAKAQAGAINSKEFELNQYVREAESNRELYNTFYSRINETSATSDFQTVNARVTDPAVLPTKPVKPDRKKIVIMAVFASLILGMMLAIFLDILDSTIKNVDDVDRKLKVSLLGIIPLMDGGKKLNKDENDNKVVRAFVDGNQHAFSESVRTLRTSLTLAGLEKPAAVILLTSSVPGEGKTTTSCNIAQCFGQLEKTLLIDADMRRPTVAKKFDFPAGTAGLSNAVAYPDTLDQCIYTVKSLGIDVMPAGQIPPNPLELLSSKNFRDILTTLRGRYQRIIIDSAPMLAVSDALYLSTMVDGVAYVIKADSTKDSMVKTALQRLDDNNSRLLGVILNQVDVEREARYGNDQGGYYDSHGYTSNNA